MQPPMLLSFNAFPFFHTPKRGVTQTYPIGESLTYTIGQTLTPF